jgi:hypothetical protein
MTKVNCCDAEFSGLKTAHCTSCHATFTVVSAFDKHRTGSHAYSTRRCVPPESVGLVDAGRGYPCYGFPPKQSDSDGLTPDPEGDRTGEGV